MTAKLDSQSGRRCGHRRNRASAAARPAGLAPRQRCQRHSRQFRPHPSQRNRPRLRPRLRPPSGQSQFQRLLHPLPPPHQDQLIRTIAQWVTITWDGMPPKRSGAAESTTFAVRSRNHHLRQIPTIAKMDSRIGRQGGRYPRKNGVAGSMAKAARIREGAGVCHRSPHHHHMIAMPDLPIGWQAGVSPRRHGVARTVARVARQRLVDALEGFDRA